MTLSSSFWSLLVVISAIDEILCAISSNSGLTLQEELRIFSDRNNASKLGHEQSYGPELDLIRSLVGGKYSKLVKPKVPITNTSEDTALAVFARLFVIRIQEVDEAHETFSATLRFQLNWVDPALSWNPSDFGNISSVVVPGGFLWLPALQIANAVDDSMYDLLRDPAFLYRVISDGNVWFHPTGKVTTRCRFDFTYYPFDYQRCLIIVESAIYTIDELKLTIRPDKSDEISLIMLAENEVWELVEHYVGGVATAYRGGDRTVFSRVHFWLVMKRKPAFYVMTLIIPTALLGVVTLFTYLVPVHYVDRTVQAVTVLLAVAVFEVMVTDTLPKTSDDSILAIYLTLLICTSAVTILTTTICLAIVDPGEFIEAPWGVPNIVRALCHNKRSCSAKKRRVTLKQATTGAEKCPTCRSDPSQTEDETHRPHCVGHARTQRHNETVPRHINEVERTFSTSKAAWYTAYAINGVSFFLCLLATVIGPIITFIILPSLVSLEDYMNQFNATNDLWMSGKVASYYGDEKL